GEHKGKPFYEPLMEFMASGPVVALIVEGDRVIEGVRQLAGPTDPIAAAPGSIRGDFGVIVRENLIHASDSQESAGRELRIFLPGRALRSRRDGPRGLRLPVGWFGGFAPGPFFGICAAFGGTHAPDGPSPHAAGDAI